MESILEFSQESTNHNGYNLLRNEIMKRPVGSTMENHSCNPQVVFVIRNVALSGFQLVVQLNPIARRNLRDKITAPPGYGIFPNEIVFSNFSID